MSRTTKKTTPTVAAQAQADETPIFGEAAALRLAMQSLALVAHGFEALSEARKTGDSRREPFDERKDGNLDIALDLVAREVSRMQAESVVWEDAARRWYQCDAAVRLARDAYSEGEETYYGRVLHSLARKFEVLPELWDFVVWQEEAASRDAGELAELLKWGR